MILTPADDIHFHLVPPGRGRAEGAGEGADDPIRPCPSPASLREAPSPQRGEGKMTVPPRVCYSIRPK
jgi:hypothetical protein